MYVLRSFLIILSLLFFNSSIFKSNDEKKNVLVTISAEELKLYNLINQYRSQKKLPKIPLSKNLTYVAQLHVKDLMENRPDIGDCNMHSWSNKGKWTSCCYTPDHKQSQCMWNKPSELTNYKSHGYEIAYNHTRGINPEDALSSWKQSKGHNPVIINTGIWKKSTWNAIGIGIYKNYAVVWFGAEKDPEGEPSRK